MKKDISLYFFQFCIFFRYGTQWGGFPLPFRIVRTNKTKNVLLKLAHLSVIPLD